MFKFAVEGVAVEKSIFMVYGQNATVIQYHVSGHGARTVQLELRPLIAFRDYHALTRENGSLDSHVHIHHERLVSVRPYVDHPHLYFAHNADELNSQGYWYRNFEYAVERERGLDCVEDLFNPFTMHFNLQARD